MENCIYLDGKKCSDKAALFSTFSELLGFPDYFSNNWDSFEEIINDLVFSQNVQLILIHNFKYLLKEYPDDRSILKDILHQSNQQNNYQFLKVKTL